MSRLRQTLLAVGPSAKLAARRSRAQPLAAVATTVALIAAAGLVGWSSLSSAVAEARSVTLRLRELPPQQRALRVVYYEVAGEPDVHSSQVSSAVASFDDLTKAAASQVTIWHPISPPGPDGTSFVVPSDLAAEATLLSGRLPQGACTAQRCEAIALSRATQLGQTLRVGPIRVRIVGAGSMRPAAVPADLTVASRMLLVRSLDDRRLERLLRSEAGMTSVTTAPLEPSLIPAASLGRIVDRLRRTVVQLNRSDSQNLVRATAPTSTLDAIKQRGTVARERLLMIAAQGAALVIAFAIFAAATRRRDARLLESQLVDLGATGAQARIAGAIEVAVPGIAALFVVFTGLVAIAAARAPQSTGRLRFVATALPTLTVLTILAIVLVSVGLLIVAADRTATRTYGVGPLELSALLALAVIIWQGVTTGGLDAARLASSSKHSPLVLLLPALCFFVSAVVLLRLLPLLTRAGERAARRAPIVVRLALLGAARSPGQTAVATAFLAVAIGCATFSLNYRATLERQANDQANYAAGGRWRVIEQSTRAAGIAASGTPSRQTAASPDDVVPLTRYARVSSEPPTPVLRADGQQLGVSAGANQEGTPVQLLALPAAKLQQLRGWRASFSDVSRTTLRTLLQPSKLTTGGKPIPKSASAVRFWVQTRAPYPTDVILWFRLPGQDTRSVRIGSVSPGNWQRLTYPLPTALRGSQLIGIDLNPATETFGPRGFRGTIWLGGLAERRAAHWIPVKIGSDWITPLDSFNRRGHIDEVTIANGPVRTALRYARNGTSLPLLRPNPHLPSPIPVLASPSVAAAAVNGVTTLQLAGSSPLAVRVVAIASHFPTITGSSRFVVADYDAMYAALNELFPGIAPPTEAWFFDNQNTAFPDLLGKPPFRLERLIGADEKRSALLADPLASGTRSVLLVTVVVAALLAVIGILIATRGTLRDESPILAEYEAMGIPPRLLARSSALRLALLSTIGVTAGAAGGLLATRLVASLIAVSADGTTPLPPIATVIAWNSSLFVLAAIALAATTITLVVARRSFTRSVAERLRT